MLIGIIGAPNQGKSTFFNALTLAGAEVASHAFTTIKPNEGVAHVKVKSLREDENPLNGYTRGGYRFVPVKVIDVAGLVPGASEGRGLGNQFMNDLISADAFIIVVDASGESNEEGDKVEGHDPQETINAILHEIDVWVHGVVSKHWAVIHKKKEPEKLLAEKLSGLGINILHVEKAFKDVGTSDLQAFSKRMRELSKPYLICANKVDKRNLFSKGIPTSSVIEFMLRKADSERFISYVPGERDFKVLKQLNPDQEQGLNFAREFLKKQGTGVQECINKVVFELLKMKTVYPVQDENKWTDAKGNILPHAHLMPSDSTTLDLAYRIHTDFGEGFIKAVDCKTKRVIGRSHVLKDNDVVKIITKK